MFNLSLKIFTLGLFTICLFGCATVETADSFYRSCSYYLESMSDNDSDKQLRQKLDGYFSCGSESLQNYCETANCSDVALEFDQRMKQHRVKALRLADEGVDDGGEIWLLELAQIFKWYDESETAWTAEKAANLNDTLRNGGKAWQQTYDNMQPKVMNSSKSSYNSRNGGETAVGCNLVAENKIDNFSKVCVYRCINTNRTKEISGIASCPSTLLP